jgi:hypothetical protein
MRKIIGLAFALSLALRANGQGVSGQTVPSQSIAGQAPLQVKLDKLAAASEELRKHLPSFTCKESLISQELRGGKVKMEARASGQLRVLRNGEGKPVEHFEAAERDGQTIAPDKLRVPIFVKGGFTDVLGFFQSDIQPCFHYSGSGNRVDFESIANAHAPQCEKQSETRGFALFSDNGDIAHVERTVPVEVARQRNWAPFAAIDLSRVELGGSSFLLSAHVVADLPDGRSTYHWEADYTGCKLFSVNVKIGPATMAEPGSDGSGAGSGAGPGPPNP